MTWRMLDLFSGIGGFSLAAQWCWGDELEIVAFCEIDKFCQKVLKKHWPNVTIMEDIKKLDGKQWAGTIDLLTGGFPCQPFSVAGKQRGIADDRWLWPEMFRIIKEIKPHWVVGENVANFFNMALKESLFDLETINYQVSSFIIPACSLNFPHKRERTWIVANSKGNDGDNPVLQDNGNTTFSTQPGRCFGDEPMPKLYRVDDGIPSELDRLKSLGNAIVPQVAYQIFKAIKEIEGSSMTAPSPT